MDRQAKIIEIINKVANKKMSPALDESLFESGLLDSFTLQDMVAALEKEFSVKIPDRDLNPRKFDTVERIEKYLEAHS